ncbi:hypothetical protein [Yersinia intermedia]|uniref:hypothetical protein n=1 Tax=Yersinia intermedia TaxID=631 RepID=UPI0005DF89C3|nr:hypothetical protein [Yersinia intermedia]CNH85533.1 Uncharacterised protein [Yersinia intermedia]
MNISEIKQSRFDSLAAYARDPRTKAFGREVGWYEIEDKSIVSCIIQDYEDQDFSGILMARDESERYRYICNSEWDENYASSESALLNKMLEIHKNIDSERLQGGVHKSPIDFFTALKKTKDKLDPLFVDLISNSIFASAKNIIEPMMRWYEDADGNFIEQFQTTGFNQRLWELYLFALLTENDVVFNQKEAIPDFICESFYGDFCIEATTVNSSIIAGEKEEIPKYFNLNDFEKIKNNYYPIKYGSALFSKLKKKYWEKPNCKDKPLVFAITDCLSPASGKDSRASLPYYLYGYRHESLVNGDGDLTIVPVKIEEHVWGEKKIPSGFFDIPEAENISAVIFSNDASFGKFNRMGLLNGFAPERSEMIREGLKVNHDANATLPLSFRLEVSSSDYHEYWTEGLEVYHNPNALHPLPANIFKGAAHHYLLPDGKIKTYLPDFHPLGSITKVKHLD